MKWLKGLIAAVVGGTATAALAVFTSPEIFQSLEDPWYTLGKVSAGAAVFNALAYLKQSPVPEGN